MNHQNDSLKIILLLLVVTVLSFGIYTWNSNRGLGQAGLAYAPKESDVIVAGTTTQNNPPTPLPQMGPCNTPKIQLVSPLSGTYNLGDSITINWNTCVAPADAKVTISFDRFTAEGKRYNGIGQFIGTTSAFVPASPGSATFGIPNGTSMSPGTYRLQIRLTGGTVPYPALAFDTSSAIFTLLDPACATVSQPTIFFHFTELPNIVIDDSGHAMVPWSECNIPTLTTKEVTLKNITTNASYSLGTTVGSNGVSMKDGVSFSSLGVTPGQYQFIIKMKLHPDPLHANDPLQDLILTSPTVSFQ